MSPLRRTIVVVSASLSATCSIDDDDDDDCVHRILLWYCDDAMTILKANEWHLLLAVCLTVRLSVCRRWATSKSSTSYIASFLRQTPYWTRVVCLYYWHHHSFWKPACVNRWNWLHKTLTTIWWIKMIKVKCYRSARSRQTNAYEMRLSDCIFSAFLNCPR